MRLFFKNYTKFDNNSKSVAIEIVGPVLANDGESEDLAPPDDGGLLLRDQLEVIGSMLGTVLAGKPVNSFDLRFVVIYNHCK